MAALPRPCGMPELLPGSSLPRNTLRAELPPGTAVPEDRVAVKSSHFVVHGRLRLDERVLDEVAWLHRVDGRVVVERRRRQSAPAEPP